MREVSQERRENNKDPYSHKQSINIDISSEEIMKNKTSEKDIIIENWADEEREEYDYHITSSGYRIKINKEFIKKYLQSLNMDMIIEIQINISEREKNSSYKDKYSKKSQIYILRQNGEIERYEENVIVTKGISLVKKKT